MVIKREAGFEVLEGALVQEIRVEYWTGVRQVFRIRSGEANRATVEIQQLIPRPTVDQETILRIRMPAFTSAFQFHSDDAALLMMKREGRKLELAGRCGVDGRGGGLVGLV